MDVFSEMVRRGAVLIFALTSLLITGCSGGGGGGAAAPSGKTSIHLMDAPSVTYDHVWITVKEAWFNKLDVDDLTDTGWIKFPLETPMTIDLAKLAAGNSQEVWNGLTLPAGTYQQIRVFLVPTEGQPLATLPAGVIYNNEVDYTDGSGAHKAPLRIPSPGQGIKVIPDSPIVVTEGVGLKLALDFNVDEDVLPVYRQEQLTSARNLAPKTPEFLLKARLRYFDMDRVAAVTGTIAPPSGTFANYTGKNFTIHAEQPNAAGAYRVVRRSASIDRDGKYTLYPLPIFGNATTASYDLVIRGRNVETFIVTGVKTHRGTTPSTATPVSSTPVTMITNTDEYGVQVNVKPAGAWVSFYQTLPNDSVPYEIRTRHIDPFNPNGGFATSIELSAGPLHVGAWNDGGPITFETVTPFEGPGNYRAAPSAVLYQRGDYGYVNSLEQIFAFDPLVIAEPATGNTISGNITVTDPGLDRGMMLITHGGMVVDNLDVSSLMGVGNNAYTTRELPGGTAAAPLPEAFYDLFVLGWNAAQPESNQATGNATGVNLQTSSSTANITMKKF